MEGQRIPALVSNYSCIALADNIRAAGYSHNYIRRRCNAGAGDARDHDDGDGGDDGLCLLALTTERLKWQLNIRQAQDWIILFFWFPFFFSFQLFDSGVPDGANLRRFV